VAKGKAIPSLLILHVAGHPDVTAQARRLGDVLQKAEVSVTLFGAKETTDTKLNADLGRLAAVDAQGRNGDRAGLPPAGRLRLPGRVRQSLAPQRLCPLVPEVPLLPQSPCDFWEPLRAGLPTVPHATAERTTKRDSKKARGTTIATSPAWHT